MSVLIYSLLGQTEEERKAFCGLCKTGGRIVKLPPRALGDEKVCPFVKFEIILPLLYSLLDPFTNKQRRTWSSMINLWIDSRTCQKYRILLSAKERSSNYLKLSKENVLGIVMLSRWPSFTRKSFMIWFHKISKVAIVY